MFVNSRHMSNKLPAPVEDLKNPLVKFEMNATRRNSNGTNSNKKDLLYPTLNRALLIGNSTN